MNKTERLVRVWEALLTLTVIVSILAGLGPVVQAESVSVGRLNETEAVSDISIQCTWNDFTADSDNIRIKIHTQDQYWYKFKVWGTFPDGVTLTESNAEVYGPWYLPDKVGVTYDYLDKTFAHNHTPSGYKVQNVQLTAPVLRSTTENGTYVNHPNLGTQSLTQNGMTCGTCTTISAKALGDADCSYPGDDDYGWHFVITQLAQEADAPTSIHVVWDGNREDVPMWKFTGGTAHYLTTSNVDSTVTLATAEICVPWTGQFNLSHRPCPCEGKLTINKTWTAGATTGGTATFNIYDNANGQWVATVTIAHPGTSAQSRTLPCGEYTIVETPPAGWRVVNSSQTACVYASANGAGAQRVCPNAVTFENQLVPTGTLDVTVDCSGATFSGSSDVATTVDWEMSDGTNTYSGSESVPAGPYQFVKTWALAYGVYNLSASGTLKLSSAGGSDVSDSDNEDGITCGTPPGPGTCTGSLKVKKSWEGTAWENITVKFKVTGPEGFVWEPTITGEGEATFGPADLTEGEYTAEEYWDPSDDWSPVSKPVPQQFSCPTQADGDGASLEFAFTNTLEEPPIPPIDPPEPPTETSDPSRPHHVQIIICGQNPGDPGDLHDQLYGAAGAGTVTEKEVRAANSGIIPGSNIKHDLWEDEQAVEIILLTLDEKSPDVTKYRSPILTGAYPNSYYPFSWFAKGRIIGELPREGIYLVRSGRAIGAFGIADPGGDKDGTGNTVPRMLDFSIVRYHNGIVSAGLDRPASESPKDPGLLALANAYAWAVQRELVRLGYSVVDNDLAGRYMVPNGLESLWEGPDGRIPNPYGVLSLIKGQPLLVGTEFGGLPAFMRKNPDGSFTDLRLNADRFREGIPHPHSKWSSFVPLEIAGPPPPDYGQFVVDRYFVFTGQ